MAITVGWSYCQILMRKRAENFAGPTMLKVDAPNYAITLASAIWHVILGIVLVFLMLFLAGETTKSTSLRRMPIDWLTMCGVPIVYSAWAASRFLPLLSWQRQVKFREYGILWDRRMLPWDHVSKYKWTGDSKDRLEIFEIDDLNRQPWLKATIPASERESVAALVAQQTTVVGKSLWGSTVIGRVPISSLLRTRVFRQHLGALVTCVVMGLGLAYMAWSKFGRVPTLDDSIAISSIALCFFGPWKWFRVGMRAGAPLVRLFARRGWLVLFMSFALALVAYFVGSQWGWLSPVVGYGAGFVFCFMTLQVTTYFFATQCDLRQNGVVLYGAAYWPWQHLCVTECDRNVTGQLVLKRGWRRIVATLPPEQREAVDRVLREKLAK